MSKSSSKKKPGQKYRFEFSISGLVSMFVFSVLIMVWMFILGVLVGRGYRPEVLIPQLAKVLPQPQQTTAPPPPPQKAEKSGSIEPLKPEELTYLDDLKKPRPTKTEPAKQASSQKKVKPAPKQEAGTADKAKEPVYRYIYQVGAFREEDRAVAFRDEALQKGFNAWYAKETVNDAVWYRVLVSFDGSIEQGGSFQQDLQKLGVKNALLRSKKAL